MDTAVDSGCKSNAWVVFHVDAFSTKPSDTKVRSHCYLQPPLLYNHNHETHPQICVYFLKYTRLKLKDFRLGLSLFFFNTFIFVLAAALLLYLLLYLVPGLQQCCVFHVGQ